MWRLDLQIRAPGLHRPAIPEITVSCGHGPATCRIPGHDIPPVVTHVKGAFGVAVEQLAGVQHRERRGLGFGGGVAADDAGRARR